MKINGIEVEGTPEELATLLNAMSGAPVAQPALTKPLSSTNLVTISDPIVSTSLDNLPEDPVVNEFISNLYYYKPDRNSQNSRAPYVVKILATSMNQQFTIKQLMKASNSNQSVVSSAIRRAASAGCVIEVTSPNKILTKTTKVRMTKLGTPQEALAVRLSLAPSAVKPARAAQTTRVRPNTTPTPTAQQEAIIRLLEAKKTTND